MNKYCLYYFPPKNDETLSDCLFVYFGGNLSTKRQEVRETVSKLYNGDTLIGYLIHHVSNYIKIKMAGPLFLPNDEIIDVLNNILVNAGVETLDYYSHSGFVVGEVKSKKVLKQSYLYEIDINKTINVESTFELQNGEKVVIALNGTYLVPGMMVSPFEIEKGVVNEGRICSNQDLNIEPLDELFMVIVDEKAKNGEDFFKVERRESDA